MEIIDQLLPEGVSALAGMIVVAVAFFSAAITAAFGLGGGLALLAVMSAVLPAAAVVPVHGVAQVGANASRFLLQYRNVLWPIVLWFSGGGVIGAALGGRIAIDLPVWALRGGVAIFILYSIYGPRPTGLSPGPRTFFATGVVGSFLTMFFGATGPIAAAMLGATNHNRLNIVATHAACMILQHGLKVAAFGLLGFSFGPWAVLITAIVISGFAGTVLGTHLLHRMPEAIFRRGFTLVLTLIAIYLLIAAAADFRTG